MKRVEKQRFYKIRKAWTRVSNGLFLFSLRNFLTRFGLDIAPYYWESEGLTYYKELKIKENPDDYEVVHIKADEIGIMHNIMGLDSQELREEIKNGQLCVGLKYQDEIVAVVMNIKHLNLFLYIGLFKRFHWNYTL